MKKILILLALVLAFTACGKKEEAKDDSKVLYLFNWSDYMPQSLLDKFAKQYDVKVTQDTYASNETLLAKLKSGVTGYDVAVPGDYMVAILIKEGLLGKMRISPRYEIIAA